MALPEIIKDIDARVIRPISTDNAIVRFDGTTGQVQNTANIIDDGNNINISGNLIPRTNSALDLGSSSYRFNKLYLASDIYINDSKVFLRNPWWIREQTHDADTAEPGITFAYAQHNAPTTGLLLTFNCTSGASGSTNYPMQFIGQYNGNSLYYRHKNGDNGTWMPWKRILTDYDYTSVLNNTYLPLSGGTLTGQLKLINGTANGSSIYQWDGATYRNPDQHTPELLINCNNSTASIAGYRPALVLYNPNGNINQTVGLTFAFRETTSSGNAVMASAIVGFKESDGTANNWSVGGLRFLTKNGGALVEAMTITGSGSVGIGTISPSYKLHVTGDIYANGGWLRTSGNAGWYNESYGGGWYMTDSTYIRAYNGKMVYGGGRFLSPSAPSSWIDGQRYNNGGYNLEDATNTGSYWPWLRQTNTASAKWFSFGTLNTSFYMIGSSTSRTENSYDYGFVFNIANGSGTASQWYGAVWNDYAEYRESDTTQPGRCIIENGDDTLKLSTERLQRGAEIVSDTFGFAIGETDTCKTPIAASGRVLAYGYEDREQFKSHIGYPVCSGPNGTVSIMTDEEEEKYPSRIIGYISAVPDYEIWGTGNVKVDGRIWIRIK